MGDKPICKTCRFRNAYSYCLKFPPVVCLFPSDNQHPIAYSPEPMWPWIKDTDWCGEHKPIEVKP